MWDRPPGPIEGRDWKRSGRDHSGLLRGRVKDRRMTGRVSDTRLAGEGAGFAHMNRHGLKFDKLHSPDEAMGLRILVNRHRLLRGPV